jgi:hypothetical protein
MAQILVCQVRCAPFPTMRAIVTQANVSRERCLQETS